MNKVSGTRYRMMRSFQRRCILEDNISKYSLIIRLIIWKIFFECIKLLTTSKASKEFSICFIFESSCLVNKAEDRSKIKPFAKI